MSDRPKTKRLIQVDLDLHQMVDLEKWAHLTRLRVSRENSPWLAQLLRETADEIMEAYGEG